MLWIFVSLALAGSLVADIRASTDNCPSNLARNIFLRDYRDTCYRFELNIVYDYWKARINCIATGGTLAMPRSKGVNDFLYYQLKNTFHATGQFWIGLNDKQAENKFVWENGTELKAGDFSNFASGEGPIPNKKWYNVKGRLDDCVAIDAGMGGKWRDFRCSTSFAFSNPTKYFICEYPKEKKSTTAAAPVVVTNATLGGNDDKSCPTLDNCNLDCDNGLKVNAQGCAECKCVDE